MSSAAVALCNEAARSLLILRKLRDDALSRGDWDEWSALHEGCFWTEEALKKYRRSLAVHCEPWFKVPQ